MAQRVSAGAVANVRKEMSAVSGGLDIFSDTLFEEKELHES